MAVLFVGAEQLRKVMHVDVQAHGDAGILFGTSVVEGSYYRAEGLCKCT